MHAAEDRPAVGMDAECRLDFRQDVLEAPRLDALRRRLRIAVHGVGDPQHLPARIAHRADHGWQRGIDAPGAEAVDQRQPAGLVVRIQDADELDQLRRSMPSPTFTAIGLAMPRKYSTCAPPGAAVRNPIHGMCVDRLYQRCLRLR